MKKVSLISSFIVVILVISFTGFSQATIENICISDNEFRLYNQINKIRIDHDEEIIPLSRSLTYIAQLHVKDLNKYHPDTSICNFHSWSDNGNWTACCYNSYIESEDCMLNKPKELTDYPAKGYEMVLWDKIALNPDSLYSMLREIPVPADMICNSGNYDNMSWESVGIAIEGKYASIWFGRVKDREGTVEVCNTKQMISNEETLENISKIVEKTNYVFKKTGRFHVIYGSFDNLNDAENTAERYRKGIFPRAGVIKSDKHFRVSLVNFRTLQEARSFRDDLGKNYEGAWILKY